MVAYSRDTSGSQLYVGLASGHRAYLSENGGGIWRELSGPFADEEIVGIALSPAFHGTTPCSWPPSPPRGPCAEPGAGPRRPPALPRGRAAERGHGLAQHRQRPPLGTGDRADHQRPLGHLRLPLGLPGRPGEHPQRLLRRHRDAHPAPHVGGKQLWMAERVGRPNTAILALGVSQGPIWGRAVFVGTSDGVFRSDDEGLTWHALREGLHSRTRGRRPDPTYHEGGGRLRPHPGGVLHRLDRG